MPRVRTVVRGERASRSIVNRTTASWSIWVVASLILAGLGSELIYMATNPEPASISDDTTQMDHNAVVLFTIDRLARSPRTTVRTRGTELAPDR